MQFQNNTKKNHTIVPGEVLQNDLDKANNSNALEKRFLLKPVLEMNPNQYLEKNPLP